MALKKGVSTNNRWQIKEKNEHSTYKQWCRKV